MDNIGRFVLDTVFGFMYGAAGVVERKFLVRILPSVRQFHQNIKRRDARQNAVQLCQVVDKCQDQ